MHRARSVVYFFIAIGNIALSIPMIQIWGPIGAAAGTAISLIVGNVFFMNWYYANRIGLEIRAFWISIFILARAMMIPFGLGLIAIHFIEINGWLPLVGFAALYTALYCVSVWKLGMNSSEKSLVLNILKKIRRRKA